MHLLSLFCLFTLIYQFTYCSVLPRRSIRHDEYFQASYAQKIKAKRSVEQEHAPYGNILGVASHNVVAYSNGNDTYISNEDHALYGVYLGMKWQCVEYARRWTFFRKSATFPSIDSANDIWTNLTYVERVLDNKQIPLKQYANGSPKPPTVGSYLIYPIQKDFPNGHIAVIVGVLPNAIHVAEQNFYFTYWKDYYSREIPLINRDGLYYIEDTYNTYGWMEIDDETNELKPLNQELALKIEGKSGQKSDSSSLFYGNFRIYSSSAFFVLFLFNFMFY